MRGWYLENSSFNQPPEQGRDMLHQARALFERALQIRRFAIDFSWRIRNGRRLGGPSTTRGMS